MLPNCYDLTRSVKSIAGDVNLIRFNAKAGWPGRASASPHHGHADAARKPRKARPCTARTLPVQLYSKRFCLEGIFLRSDHIIASGDIFFVNSAASKPHRVQPPRPFESGVGGVSAAALAGRARPAHVVALRVVTRCEQVTNDLRTGNEQLDEPHGLGILMNYAFPCPPSFA